MGATESNAHTPLVLHRTMSMNHGATRKQGPYVMGAMESNDYAS